MIVKTPGVCGGDACVRGTRIAVWILVRSRQMGRSDGQILEDYPQLTQGDLRAAFAYALAHAEEIDRAIQDNL